MHRGTPGHMRLPHRLQGQKSRWGGGILWRRPSRTACRSYCQTSLLVDVEIERVDESRRALRQAQLKCVSERCRQAQEQLRLYKSIKNLKRQLEDDRTRFAAQLQQLENQREKLQKLVKCADLYMIYKDLYVLQ